MKKELLSTVANVFNGKTPSKNEQRSSGLPILKIRDIDENGNFKGLFESFVDADFYGRFENKRLRTGDTIVLNAAHNSAYVGSKTALVPEAIDGVIATGEWLIIRPIKADKDFVNQFIKSPQGLNWLKSKVKGIHLYPSDVAQIKIALPESLDDQIRIAALLTRAEKLIAKRKESIKALDELAKSAFLEMFGDPVRNEKGWKILPFSKVAKNENSKRVPVKQEDRDKREGVYPYYGATGIIDTIDDYKFDGVFLLIAEDGKNLLFRKKNNAFMAAGKFWANNHAHVLSSNGVTDLRYLEFILNNLDFKPYLSGIDQVKLTRENLDRIPIPIPAFSLQSRFSSLILKLESLKSLYTQSLTSLENLYSSLSQRAFAGELDLGRVPASRYDAKASTR